MKYCEKCNTITDENVQICPKCGKGKLRSGEPAENFPTVIVKASGFEKERICAVLDDEGIPHSEKITKKQFSSDAVTGSSLAEYEIMVPYGAYSKAFELLVGINAIKIESEDFKSSEKLSEKTPKIEDFDGEDYYSTKNRIIRVVSVILFLIIVGGVVLGVDAVMALIKGLF